MVEESRIARIESDISVIKTDMSGILKGMGRLESDVAHLQGDVTDIKATLAQLMPMIIRIDQKLSDVPSGTEVAELRGRVEEQSKFLQLALAGRQPKRSAAE
jgi:archaellum component FlaC